MALYVPWFIGLFAVPTLFSASDWFHHSILLGVVPIVLAGQVVARETRRPALLALVFLWLTGRATVACSEFAGPAFAAAADSSFFVAVVLLELRGSLKGTGIRGLLRASAFAGLLCANAAYHWEVWRYGMVDTAQTLAVAASLAAALIVAKEALHRYFSASAVWVAFAFAGLACLLSVGTLVTAIIPAETAMHAWTSGAAATMCAAALIGHDRHAVLVVACVASAALLLMLLGWFPRWTLLLLPVAGLTWIAAFLAASLLGRRTALASRNGLPASGRISPSD